MMRSSPWLLLLVTACASAPSPEPDATVKDTSSADTDDTVPATSDDTARDSAVVADSDTDVREPPSPDWQSLELNGEFPRAFTLPPDAFVAINADGQERGPPDLVGHPTVLWFFPASGTPG